MPRGLGWVPALVLVSALVALEVGLDAWRATAWPTDFGAPYALTARLLLNGHALYGDVAAAQPPPLYWTGAGVLGLADRVEGLRLLLGAVSAATALLVALATARLTGSARWALGAGLASVLAPWSLDQHDVFTPEPFAGLLLLAATMLLSTQRRGVVAGVLAAVAGAFKLAYFLPAILLVLVAPRRRAYGCALALSVALLASVFVGLYGQPLIDGVLVAQAQSGLHTVREVAQLLAQGGWNLLPLLVCAAFAMRYRDRSADPRLALLLTVLVVGELVSFGSLAKRGTYLNVLATAEPPAVALGAAGLRLSLQRRRRGAGGGRGPAVVGSLAAVLVALQSGSLLLRPTEARIFLRPFSRLAHGPLLSRARTDSAVVAARRCPDGLPYSGSVAVAFLAHRSVPGDQPDLFIVRAPVESKARARIARAAARCP